MSVEDKEKLTRQMHQQVTKTFELDEFVTYTLNSFAHRYLESQTTGKVQTIKMGHYEYSIVATETNFKAFQKRPTSLH